MLPGDIISLCTNAGREFAKAKVVWIKETTFRSLSREDFEGHEEFASPEEMYQAYSKWYKMEVTPDTMVTVIKFKLALIQLKNK